MQTKLFNKYILTIFLFPLTLLHLAGCANNPGPSNNYLLNQDYQSMSNVELIAYEQELSDQIARASASSSGGTSIGFGFGSWGNNSGVGIGASQHLRDGDPAKGLRVRRDAVRIEMRNRGLLSP